MLFGHISDGTMILNDAGCMVEDHMRQIQMRFPDAVVDTHIVMPNHIHALIVLGDDETASLSAVMHWFKTVTTTAYIGGVKEQGWPRFDRHLWQPSYYDQIRRSDRHIANIRRYIEANPVHWERDAEYVT
jgi:REP element-mobilizing transposase RayT